MSDSPTEGRPLGPLSNLRRRIYLTYSYFGLRTILFRAITFPLRFTPLERRLRLRTHARDQELRRAVRWQADRSVRSTHGGNCTGSCSWLVHVKDGIGAWSVEDLANAMLKGVSPSGEHFYPAFPYTSYARMNPADIADLYAFLKTNMSGSATPVSAATGGATGPSSALPLATATYDFKNLGTASLNVRVQRNF